MVCHELEAIPGERARLDRLCELNVIREVRNVASEVFVQDAWAAPDPTGAGARPACGPAIAGGGT